MTRLSERFGWVRASIIVGVLWAAWHAVMFALQGFNAPAFALGMLMIAAGSIIFGWLFQRTHGSLLVAVIAHAGVHLDNPSHALPQNITAYGVFAGAVCVVALALVLAIRARLGTR
jgi:membrane protease YdiL (CAAX protease family)